jgi:hypothetical protein
VNQDDHGKLLERAILYAAGVLKTWKGTGSPSEPFGVMAGDEEWAESAIASAFVIGYNAALADMPRGRR